MSRSGVSAGPRGALGGAAASGLALFLLGLAAPPEGPQIGGASAAEVRDFVAGNDVALRVAATTGMLVAVALLVFTASLAALVQRADPGSLLAPLVGGAGVLLATVQLLTTASLGMLRLLPDLVGTRLADVPDADVRTWYGFVALTHFLGDLQTALMAVIVLGASVPALRRDVLPRWVGWTGLAVGTAAALGAVGATTATRLLYGPWFVGLFGFWLWALLVAGACAVRARSATRTAPAGVGEAARSASR